MIQVVQCKVCPVCNGAKVRDVACLLPTARRELQCSNCQGEGIVPLLTCRGCGRAAMHWDAKIPYCGRKECWDRLVEEIDLEKVREARPFPLGPHRGLGVETRRNSGSVRNWEGRYWNPYTGRFQGYPPTASDGERLTREELADFTNACEGYCG